jgi:Uma2 family endonuclease
MLSQLHYTKLYAESGIPEYHIFDIYLKTVEVCRESLPLGYRETEIEQKCAERRNAFL